MDSAPTAHGSFAQAGARRQGSLCARGGHDAAATWPVFSDRNNRSDNNNNNNNKNGTGLTGLTG